MKCVKTCEFIGLVEDKHVCKYHKVPIIEDTNGVLHRCTQCERHAYYNRLVNEIGDMINDYNGFVASFDKKVDDMHFLMEKVKEKI